MYQLPQEISSKTEIFRGITFEDMIFVLLYFMFFYIFQRFVYAGLVVIYYVFNIAVAIYLILNKKKLNVGRVQTPTLGLVVARDEAIEGHQRTYYYNLACSVTGSGIEIGVKFYPPKDAAYLEDGKCLDKEKLKEICEKLSSEKEEFPGAVRGGKKRATAAAV